MSYLRTQNVFFALMGISAMVAFAVPPKYTNKYQPQIQMLFAPVSRPVASVAAVVNNRVAPPVIDDRRATQDIRKENQQLRAELGQLRIQLAEMYRRDAELAKLGSVKEYCQIFEVIGGDSGTRESLSIAGSTLMGLKDEMYVLCSDGLVGQVQRAGSGGAQVKLITDPAFRVRVRFVRVVNSNSKSDVVPLGTPIVLAEGAGDGTLVVRGLSLADIGLNTNGKPNESGETLHEGTDYAVLFDADCPRQLQGQPIGRVTRIESRPDARLFAEVRLRPETNLKKLREVMVMTREN